MSEFKWTKSRSDAACLLAEGYTVKYVAEQVGVTVRAIGNWKHEVEFSAEVDHLSCFSGLAGRAARLRYAQRHIRGKISGASDKHDLLDWLKYIQSETDGIELCLAENIASAFVTASEIAAGKG